MTEIAPEVMKLAREMPADIMDLARSIRWRWGVFADAKTIEEAIARAIMADRVACQARVEELERRLGNLAHEMRFLLRSNPKMDGGLYRQRLTEAETALGLCRHNCDEGGICLAEHSGFPESCPTDARATLEGK